MTNSLSVLLGTSVLAAGVVLATAPARAASVTYNLGCVFSGSVGSQSFSGSTVCHQPSPATSFGTLTLKDVSGGVELKVDLTGTVNKILAVDLNYDDAKFSKSSPFTISFKSIGIDENKVKANGYKGYFDLAIPKNGNIGTIDTFTAKIALGSGSLTIADLAMKDTLNNVFGAVHIGDYGGNPGIKGKKSIWVGATTPVNAVPEPLTMLGVSAAAGFGAFFKKRLAKNA